MFSSLRIKLRLAFVLEVIVKVFEDLISREYALAIVLNTFVYEASEFSVEVLFLWLTPYIMPTPL